jgi:nitrite reductase/ring-hydroxylating ferredoxin subunit
MTNETWHDLGSAEAFQQRGLCEAAVGRLKLAITCKDGVFGAVSNVCNHVGGPLGQGRLDSEYVVCPWHSWKFHRRTGLGQPGNEDAAVPSHEGEPESGSGFVVCSWLRLGCSQDKVNILYSGHR